MEQLEYRLDELNTRIALLQMAINETNPWSSDMAELLNRQNILKIKRESIIKRIERGKKHYKERTYLPDITIMR